MATNTGRQKKTSELAILEELGDSDRILVVSGTALTATISKEDLFSGIASLSVLDLNVANSSTPANSTVIAEKGKIWFDANYLYVAVANNVIKRATLDTF